MKIGKYNVPASWWEMSVNERANYLINSNQVKNYAIGMAFAKKGPQAKPMPKEDKREYWYNRGDMA